MLGDELIAVDYKGEIIYMYEWVYWFVKHCKGKE